MKATKREIKNLLKQENLFSKKEVKLLANAMYAILQEDNLIVLAGLKIQLISLTCAISYQKIMNILDTCLEW